MWSVPLTNLPAPSVSTKQRQEALMLCLGPRDIAHFVYKGLGATNHRQRVRQPF